MRKQHRDAAGSWQVIVGSGDGEFIREVRGRLARGDFAGLGPVGVHGGTLDASLAVRIMLADWHHFDDLPAAQRDDMLLVARRRLVLSDLRALVATLDERRGRLREGPRS